MSFQEEWVLLQPVQSYSTTELLVRVRALLPANIAVTITGELDERVISVRFSVADIDPIAETLAQREGQLDWDWRDEVDDPESVDGMYNVHIDIVDDGQPLVRLFSNDGDNRAAWPLVFTIAASLAEELGAVQDEEMSPLSDGLTPLVTPAKPWSVN